MKHTVLKGKKLKTINLSFKALIYLFTDFFVKGAIIEKFIESLSQIVDTKLQKRSMSSGSDEQLKAININ